ncbi:MAG: hypothetical protein WCO60_07380 [Verrucomicrobiota bacterium]
MGSIWKLRGGWNTPQGSRVFCLRRRRKSDLRIPLEFYTQSNAVKTGSKKGTQKDTAPPHGAAHIRTQGAALLLTLACISILSAVLVAFLSLACAENTAASADTAAQQSAQTVPFVVQLILKDLHHEILAGSQDPNSSGYSDTKESPILYPATRWSFVSSLSAKTASPPLNLIKQSAFGVPSFPGENFSANHRMYPNSDLYPAATRATNVQTTTPSLNGRFVSAKRWNRSGLLPRKQATSFDDLTPASHGIFNSPAQTGAYKNTGPSYSPNEWDWMPPDWILLQRNGDTPTAWSIGNRWSPQTDSSVRHRFAYQIFNTGGLLDLNVAGFTQDSVQRVEASRRGSCGLADLSQIGFRESHIASLVNWRNAGTLTQHDAPPFGNRYLNFLFCGPINQGFLRTAHIHPLKYSHKVPVTNRAIVSRAALIDLVSSLGSTPREKEALTDSLQYLNHFSRSLEQPSVNPKLSATNQTEFRPRIVPPAGIGDLPTSEYTTPKDLLLGANYRGGNDSASQEDLINPAFLSIRAQSPFLRSSGHLSTPCEALVKSKFPLSRLRWITAKGPSCELPKNHIQHNEDGTAEAIYTAFGLRWDRIREVWEYEHKLHLSRIPENKTIIATLDRVRDANREPNFFELLKASISAGSLGKAAAIDHPHTASAPCTPNDSASFQQRKDRSLDLQVFQIGANIIDQYDPDSFPTLLSIPSTSTDSPQSTPKEDIVRGIEDLPYFYRLHLAGVPNADDLPIPPLPSGHPIEITTDLSAYKNYHCGTTSVLALPELWNPHSQLGSGSSVPPPTQFRCIACSEDPEGYYPIGSSAWQNEGRFKIRPNVAFAAIPAPNQPASLFFSNKWPSSSGSASISNELAPSRGFWPDIYSNFWNNFPPSKDLYAIQCYPFFRLPVEAESNAMPSEPSDQFHVDRYFQGIHSSPVASRFFALGEQNAPVQTFQFESSQVEVDTRGTELLFQVPNRSLFREPTTLCKPGHPVGSDLKTGAKHWFLSQSFKGKNKGYITEAGTSSGGNAQTWVGFPMGERPTTWIMAAKLIDSDGIDTPADQYGWDPNRGPREKTGFMGSFQYPGDAIRPPSTILGTGTGWYTPAHLKNPRVSLWRFFQVPANTINIQPTLLTIRLQYQTQEGKWQTYDERYIQCEGDFTSRFDFKQHANDPDGSGNAWYCLDNHQRSTPIPWSHTPVVTPKLPHPTSELGYGHPLVSAYDPRTARFGHPVTPAFVGFAYSGILPDWSSSILADRWVDSLPSPDGSVSGPILPTFGPIHQKSCTLRPLNSPPAQTATLMVPGGYSNSLTDPKLIGWFPNLIWNSPQTKLIASGTLRKNLPPIEPPRFARTPWYPGGQAGNPTIFRPGWLSENTATPLHQYYADPDDIVRRATGAYSDASIIKSAKTIAPDQEDYGNPQSQSAKDTGRQSRPIILNRPFRSVAEMGYAFRGTPWKHIDFFTPESGDAALLDVFTVNEAVGETPLVAGKVNLNTPQIPVLKALLAGALKDELHAENVLAESADAEQGARALERYTHGPEAWQGPLTNLSELVSRPLGKNFVDSPPEPGLCSTTPFYTYTIPPGRPDAGPWSFSGFCDTLNTVFQEPEDLAIQRRRESVIRALVDCGQVRVWNLMVDLIVQTGKYPGSASNGAEFLVEAENRVWLHVALDRYTGEILDEQLEWVSE